MGDILNTVGTVRKNWNTYEKWEQEQDSLEQKKKEYRKQNPIPVEKKKEAEKYGNAVLNAINVMDEYSENKAEDMELATQAVMQFPVQIGSLGGVAVGGLIGSKVAKGKYMLPLLIAGSTIGTIAAFIPASVIATKAQIWASKVARFQAREKELKDPENFVIYTPEQIEQGQKIAATMPDEKDKESKIKKFIPIAESVSTIKSIYKDKENYKNWHKKYQEEDKQIKVSYQQGIPADKQQKALKDQQLIVNAVKKINIKAEEYSENIETATNTVGFFAEFGIGAAVGTATNFIINKLKISPDSFIGKNKKLVSGIAGVIPMLAMATYFTLLQKDAARIGRFKAKQELLADPGNFVYEDEEKIKSASKDINLTKKKGFFSEIVQSTKQLINSRKDKKEYKEYKKTKAKEEKKLRNALKQVNVSDGQLNEAKNLQEKTFNAFEKIDDMSQKYSETIEMTTEIAQGTIPALMYLGLIGAGTGLWLYAEKKFKNLNPMQLIEKASNFYDKVSKFIKPVAGKPFVKRFLDKTKQEAGEVASSLLEGALEGKGMSLGRVASKAMKKPTLRKIGLGAGIPILAGFVGSIYAMQLYFTSLQKKAGKIGIMKAMEELQDPRYFVDIYSTGQPTQKTQPAETKPSNSVLERYIQIKNQAA
ncbi:MAG: hypothetical protein A2Y25_02820 [Candidatus Melainabacteria bacterium GWF2_37_15]|nr:MAG: hypothetical protein A2Y25_02820 [Candidatus Melainabacteria bacterium GWF2_37_15]